MKLFEFCLTLNVIPRAIKFEAYTWKVELSKEFPESSHSITVESLSFPLRIMYCLSLVILTLSLDKKEKRILLVTEI